MSPRRARVQAAAAFAATLLVGVAFLNQGEQQREAERRLAAMRAADRVAAVIEREAASAMATVGAAAAGRDAARATAVEALLHIADGKLQRRQPPGPVRLDIEELVAPGGGDLYLLGPLRANDNSFKLALRATRPSEGNAAAYVVGVIDVHALVSAAGLPQLMREGFEHRLVSSGPRMPVLSRSREDTLRGAVARTISFGPGSWTLELAPSGGWRSWPALGLHGLLVLVLAFAAGLVSHERAKESTVLREAIGQRDARLREATQRLLEEAQQREELEKQFSHASFHDSLTGLPNRRFLVNRLENALKRSRAGGEGLPAIAVVELGRLKPISDSLGLAVADELLRQAARRFEEVLGPGQVVCRSADTAYATVLGGTREAVLERVNVVQQALSQSFTASGHTLFVVARAGVAFAESGYDHPEDLVRSAHIALSRAKREQARAVVFDASTQEQVISRQQIETDLHGVVERGELRIHYQPIIELASGRIAGFEALVRWQHPREGMISPGLFIPLAEETGLIEPITRWVMLESCRQALAWNVASGAAPRLYVSVNLSAHDMRLADMGDYVEGVIAEAGVAPDMLRLEVTESSMIDNLRAAIALIARFRAMGVKVLLDDFGTGYSSLSYLNQFEIDFLKIDQSFVRQMTPDPRSSGIVRAILSMCEGMNIRTVAEGIESAEAMQLLHGLRCDYGQGYFFSKPVDAQAAARLVIEGVGVRVAAPAVADMRAHAAD